MDGLTANRSDYVMADPGEYYAIYRPYGTAGDVKLDLSGQSGETFDVAWYDPRNGGQLISDGTVSGGGVRQIGGAPSAGGKDWVLLVKNSDLPDVPLPAGPDPAPGPGPEPEPEPQPEPTENAAPAARDDEVGAAAGSQVRFSVVGNDSDADGDTLAVVSFTQGQHGDVYETNDPGEIRYYAPAGFSGTDTFTYTVGDGNGGTDTATVTVTVDDANEPDPEPQPEPKPQPEPEPTNAAPTAENDQISVTTGSGVRIEVVGNDSDPDGDALQVLSFYGSRAWAGACHQRPGRAALLRRLRLRRHRHVQLHRQRRQRRHRHRHGDGERPRRGWLRSAPIPIRPRTPTRRRIPARSRRATWSWRSMPGARASPRRTASPSRPRGWARADGPTAPAPESPAPTTTPSTRPSTTARRSATPPRSRTAITW